MDAATQRLLNDYQRGFPLVSRPFLQIGGEIGLTEAQVIERLAGLQNEGIVSRVGAVIRPNTIGASTLAAMVVPEARLRQVADAVSARPEVNHNYRREHRFNLWFVATAPDARALRCVLADIETSTALPVMALPLAREYHIDLGFRLDGMRHKCERPGERRNAPAHVVGCARLFEAMQPGLSLCPRPYAAVAASAGLTEEAVLCALRDLQQGGVIKRFGIIVRHHELGYSANAMVVWDVPDAEVDHCGLLLAKEDAVTLCYRRERHRPHWPYNLYCMIHGREHGAVNLQIAQLRLKHGLGRFASDVLFSTHRFKQRGACYAMAANGG